MKDGVAVVWREEPWSSWSGRILVEQQVAVVWREDPWSSWSRVDPCGAAGRGWILGEVPGRADYGNGQSSLQFHSSAQVLTIEYN